MFEFVVYTVLLMMLIGGIIGLGGFIFYCVYLIFHMKEFWDYIEHKKSDPMDYYGYTHGHDSGSSD